MLESIMPKLLKLRHQTDILLYVMIINECIINGSNTCSLSNDELAKLVRVSPRSITLHLKQLEVMDYIRVKRINQYTREIKPDEYDVNKVRRSLVSTKGPKEPEWMAEYMAELAKMDQQ